MSDEKYGAICQTPDNLARLLGVDVDLIQEHVQAGAPVADGKIHLIHYVAWLVRKSNGDKSA